MAGFIMLDRDLQDSYVFQNDRNWWMWCKLKYLEKFEDGEVRLGKSRAKISYKKGQIAILLKDLSRELKITHKPLREFLETLVDEGLIEVDIQPKHTIITFIYANESSNQKSAKFKRKNGKSESNVQPSPIIEEIEEEKEGELINTPPLIFSREKEIGFYNELSGNATFIDELAMSMKVESKVVREYFGQFRNLQLTLEKSHRDLKDCRHHFISWLRIELDKVAKKRINKVNGNQETTNKHEARRGNDVGNHTQDDYGGSF